MTIPRFLLIITGVAVALLGLGYLMLELLAPERSYLAAAVAIIVGYLTTMVAYSVTYSSLNKKTNTFVAALLTGMVAKMFAGLITIVIVALRFEEVRGEYVGAFMLAYMVFTSFEVYGLMRKLRPHSEDIKQP